MKRILFIFISILCSISLFSQNKVIPCNCECSGILELASGKGYFLLDSIKQFSWDRTNELWKELSTSVFHYDENLRKYETIGFRFENNSSQNIPSYRILYLYGEHGEKTSYLNYRWEPNIKTWETTQKIELKYNENLKITNQAIYKSGTGKNLWEAIYHSEYSYNGKGQTDSFVKKVWDHNKSLWLNNFKSEYSQNGSNSTTVSYKWESDAWVPVSRSVYIYNSHGILAKTYYNQWNAEANSWFELRQMEYLFDELGRKTEWISTGSDKPGDPISRRGHQMYHYDKDGKLSEVVGISGTENSPEWEYSSKRVYFWSLHASNKSLEPERYGKLKVYPNPFEDYTTLELPSTARRIDILDIQGRVVRTYGDPEGLTIKIYKEDLQPALYFIKVYSDMVYTARIVIF